MADEFADLALTTLAAAIGTGDTEITVVDGSRFPTPVDGYDVMIAANEDNPATVKREKVRVTAKTGNVFTVTRDAWGEGAQSFDAGAVVEQRLFASAVEKYEAAADTADAVADAITAHVADPSAAHAASAISFAPAGSIAATDVQAAIEEVASEAGGGMAIDGAVTGATAGSVLFVGAGGVLAEDNPALTYDPATNVLSLAGGNVRLTSGGRLQTNTIEDPGSGGITVNDLVNFRPDGVNRLWVSSSGIGINETAPDAMLEIVASGATEECLHLKGAASQTAKLLRITDSADVDLFSVSPNREITMNGYEVLQVTLAGADALRVAEDGGFTGGVQIYGGTTRNVWITSTTLGFFGVTAVTQPAGIADADGSLADITTKFNSLVAKLESLGLLATV